MTKSKSWKYVILNKKCSFWNQQIAAVAVIAMINHAAIVFTMCVRRTYPTGVRFSAWLASIRSLLSSVGHTETHIQRLTSLWGQSWSTIRSMHTQHSISQHSKLQSPAGTQKGEQTQKQHTRSDIFAMTSATMQTYYYERNTPFNRWLMRCRLHRQATYLP